MARTYKDDTLAAEYAGFLRQLQTLPVIDQDYAERLLRPLASRCFDLRVFPDEALRQIFTLPRLQQIFPLALRPSGWYDAPRLHLPITEQDFVVPYGWTHFSELLSLLSSVDTKVTLSRIIVHPDAILCLNGRIPGYLGNLAVGCFDCMISASMHQLTLLMEVLGYFF